MTRTADQQGTRSPSAGTVLGGAARPRSGLLLAVVGAAVLLACTQPARCDLLGDLFGIRQPAADAPALTVTRGRSPRAPRRKPSRPRVEASATAHKLQRTRAILDDDTLRDGDALMAKDGIRVYAGERSATHTVSQFIPLARARNVSKDARALLLAIHDARARQLSGASPPQAGTTRPATPAKLAQRPHPAVRYVGP